MSTAHGQLSSLVILITDATKTVEAHFNGTHRPYVPSLDDTEPHPLDLSFNGMELRLAIQTIQGACAQLVATVSRPSQTMFYRASAFIESACLGIVTRHNVANLLSEQPGGALHTSEIAERTGLNQNKIERIMRSLATRHIFREVSEGVFMNNRLSIQLLKSPDLAELIQYETQEVMGAITCLNEVLVDKEWGHSFVPNHTAFNKYTGYSGHLFQYYSEEDSSVAGMRGARFAMGMLGWAAASEAASVVTEFPWKDLPEGTAVVDVGSGIGAMSIELAKNHPSLQIFLQDQPERMIEAGEKFWPQECPEAIAEGRVHFEPIDFFVQSPKDGADIYCLKHILHDWEDELAVKILTNVRKAMASHSRVLIYEHILQDATHLSDERYIHKKAPQPLLSNYGCVLPYDLDMIVMLMVNGSERQLQEHIALGERAGLKFVKFWDLGGSGIIEFMLLEVMA